MTFRWYGEGFDTIPLSYIRQIPGVEGAVCTLMDKMPGEVWTCEEIAPLYQTVRSHGLHMEVIESVNVHDDIKMGLPSRDKYIENYRQTIRNLSRFGVKVICYNFMPVFDWMRTQLHRKRTDGSTTLAYQQNLLESLREPGEIVSLTQEQSGGAAMPGWEPERLDSLQRLFDGYRPLTDQQLRQNLQYFLRGILPVCEECDVRMAIHPDDPPWRLFDLPRIAGSEEDLQRLLDLADSPYHGLTFCSGSLGADPQNDLVAMIRRFGGQGRIHFAHVRNVRWTGKKDFEETAHLSADGSLDLYEILKAFHDVGFTGYMRPDHGRMIWGEKGRPGYGLYDRALGAVYLQGLWEAIEKGAGR